MNKATVDGEAVVEAAVEGMVVAAVLDMAAVDGPRLRLMRLPTRWMGQRWIRLQLMGQRWWAADVLDMAAVNGVTAAVDVAADVVDGAAVVKAAVDGAAAAEAMVVADVLDKAAVDGAAAVVDGIANAVDNAG